MGKTNNISDHPHEIQSFSHHFPIPRNPEANLIRPLDPKHNFIPIGSMYGIYMLTLGVY